MKTKIFKSITLLIFISFFFKIANGQWIIKSTGLEYQIVTSLVVSENYIFAGTFSNGIYISTNNGNIWTQNGLNNIFVWSLAVSGNNIFVGTNNHGVYLSTNNGITWTQTSLNNRNIWSLAASTNNPNDSVHIILAGTQDYGVYLSTNIGLTWTQTSLNNKSIFSFAIKVNNSKDSNKLIFAGTNTGVYVSTDNGNNWTQTSPSNLHGCLAISDNTIFMGTWGSGVYYSTNNGSSWMQTALNDKFVECLTVSNNSSKHSGHIIYAGAISGIYLSSNNGINWFEKNQGFTGNHSVLSLLISNDYIFASLNDHPSIWRRPISEITGNQTISTEIPSAFSLEQNYPNPFNSMTNVKFKMLNAGIAVIKVFDISGKEVATLVNEKLQPGVYSVRFDAGTLPSGIYFYRMQTETYTETKRMTLVK